MRTAVEEKMIGLKRRKLALYQMGLAGDASRRRDLAQGPRLRARVRLHGLHGRGRPDTSRIVVCYSLAMAALSVSQEKVGDFCRRNHIKRLAFFGSVLRDDFRPDSDLDVIVEFEPGHVPGLRYFAMERELSEILGRKVDLNTPGTLSKYFRDRVLAEAEPQYVAP